MLANKPTDLTASKGSSMGRTRATPRVESSTVAAVFTRGTLRMRLPFYGFFLAPYLPWVHLAFADFYSLKDPRTWPQLKRRLARSMEKIVRAFQKARRSSQGDQVWIRRLRRVCQTVDNGHIWHQGGGPIRSFLDASLQANIIRRVVEGLSAAKLDPRSSLELAGRITALQPDYRPAFLALAEMQFQAGELDQALEAVNQALILRNTCPSSQQLLAAIHRAKGSSHTGSPSPSVLTADLRERFCAQPFETLQTGTSGCTFICECGYWQPFSVGDVVEAQSLDAIWNSLAAQEIRRSILDGDFSYCSRTLCPYLAGHWLPTQQEVQDPVLRDIIAHHRTHLPTHPRQLTLSHDNSCNLACPSCRTEVMTAPAKEQAKLDQAMDSWILPLLRGMTGKLFLSGYGDPLASRHYRRILAALKTDEFPQVRIYLTTNGQLLTPEQWRQLKPAHPLIERIGISIDAATAQTYERLRPPGRWDRLINNVRFLAQERRSGAYPRWQCLMISFVVQQENFHEMTAFVQMGLALDVDQIMFQKLMNFGNLDYQQFFKKDVTHPNHPDHAQFQEILAHPLMRHHRVCLPNLVAS